MSEAVRKSPRKKPEEPRPTQEELIQSEVERRVSAIIDLEAFDRQMVTRLTNVVGALCETRCTEHPMPSHVETAMNDALIAALERIERIASNDRPYPHLCGKCGD